MDKALAIFILLAISPLQAATRYVSQAGGLFSGGTNCNGQTAISVAALSTTVQSAGDINWLCGTITSGFTVDGAGSNGNPVQFLWDTSARISVTAGQIINLNSESYLLFDGGNACGPNTLCYQNESVSPTGYPANITGIIEATANGSGLANQNVTTQATYGCNPCGGTIEIRNLIIRNLYQHTSSSDNTANADSGNFVFQCSSGATACTGTISIHDIDIHDTGNAISLQHFSAATVKVFNIECWHNNWCIENSGNGTRTLFFHDFHCHDAANWDTGADTYHHNCIHEYMNTSSDSLGDYDYNIRSDGDWGTCCTTSNFVFTEVAPPANHFIFNNYVFQKCSNTELGEFTRTQNLAAGATQYNNTFEGCASVGSNVEAVEWNGTGQVIENNAIENYGQYVTSVAAATYTTLDYNFYGAIGTSGNSPWVCQGNNDANFAAWQASCSADTHGGKLSSLGINTTTGAPNAGSGLIGAGLNLTSLCTGNLVPLCSDINGNPRPNAAWTVGAVNAPASPGATKASPIMMGEFR